MPLQNDYQRVARRSLDASIALLAAGIQEKAAFLSYHAFESTGSALSIVEGHPVGPRVHHQVKISNFTLSAQNRGNGMKVATLAVSVVGIRNSLLYPMVDAASGIVRRPESVITLVQARLLEADVLDIVDWVDTQI